MNMKAQEFVNLYTQQEWDETITPFENEVGFSLIRFYPKNTLYYKDDKRMFIKVAILDRGLFYEVNMTKPEKRGETTGYVIKDGEEYRKKVTGFMSSNDNEFAFDEASKKIVHIPTKKPLSLNEFIDVLEGNHLSDRLYFKRILNTLADRTLKVFFWLSDKHYEKIHVSLDRSRFTREHRADTTKEELKSIEPFFKYFYISRNMIFGTLLLVFLLALLVALFPTYIPLGHAWHTLFGEFTLSNPLLILFVFLVLFTSEKISVWLNTSINRFLKPEQNHFAKSPKESFIAKLHDFQYHSKFNLKLNLRASR